MIGERFGHFLDMPLAPVARRIRVAPNVLTFIGFTITIGGSAVLTRHLVAGSLLVLLGALFDLLDGIVARVNDRATPFGAFLDSVLDRLADAAMFLALAWYLFKQNNIPGAVVSILVFVAAVLVSYARARAEGIGVRCSIGIMERPERIILFCTGCLTGWIMPILWIMVVLTSLTLLQRLDRVWRDTGASDRVPKHKTGKTMSVPGGL